MAGQSLKIKILKNRQYGNLGMPTMYWNNLKNWREVSGIYPSNLKPIEIRPMYFQLDGQLPDINDRQNKFITWRRNLETYGTIHFIFIRLVLIENQNCPKFLVEGADQICIRSKKGDRYIKNRWGPG